MGFEFRRNGADHVFSRGLRTTTSLDQHWTRPSKRRPPQRATAAPDPSIQKLHFEPLEPRILLNADIWAIALATEFTTSDGFYTLDVIEGESDDSQQFRIYVGQEGEVGFEERTREITDLSEIRIEGTDSDDTLRIDFGVDPDLFFQIGISFDGGAGDDTLILEDDFAQAQHDAALSQLFLHANSDSATLSYKDVETLRLEGLLQTVSHFGTNAAEEINFEGAGADFSQITNTAAPAFQFANPVKEVRIDAREGDDTITLDAASANFTADLVLVFGNDWGHDTLVVNDFEGVVTLDFGDHDDVASAQLQDDKTLQIISGDDFDAPAASLTINTDALPIDKIQLRNAEFDVDDGGANVADAILELRDQIGTALEVLKDLINDSPLATELPLLQQVVEIADGDVTEDFAVGTSFAQLLRLNDFLEQLDEGVSKFADGADQAALLNPLNDLRSGGPLSLQLAQLILDLAKFDFTFEEGSDSPLAVLGKLSLAVTAVRLMPQRTGTQIDGYEVQMDVEGGVNTIFAPDFGEEASILGLRFLGDLPAIQAGARFDGMLGLSVANLGTAPAVSLSTDSALGLDLDVASGALDGDTFTAGTFTLGIGLGVLEASIKDGAINAGFAADISFDNGNPVLEIDDDKRDLSISLPFEVNVDGFSTGQIFGDGGLGSLEISLDDVFAGGVPQVSAKIDMFDDLGGLLSEGYDLLQAFSTASPGDIFGMLGQFRSLFEQLVVSDLLTAEIPLVGKRLNEMLPFVDAIEQVILGPLFEIADNGVEQAVFDSVQELTKLINDGWRALVDDAAAEDIVFIDFRLPGLELDVPDLTLPPEIQFTFDWQQTFLLGDVPVAFDFELGDLGNISVRPTNADDPDASPISPKLSLEADVHFNFTFGIELAPGDELFLGLPMFVAEPGDDLRNKGKLASDAEFSFKLFDRVKTGEPNGDGTPEILLKPLSDAALSVKLEFGETTNNISAGSIILRSVSTGTGAQNTLVDADGKFTTRLPDNIDNETVFVRIISGTGAGQLRQISGTSDTELTVKDNWTTAPDSTSRYEIVTGQRIVGGGIDLVDFRKISDEDGAPSRTAIIDRGSNFSNRLNDAGIYFVEIIDGAERGKIYEIESWSGNQIFLKDRQVALEGATSDIPGRYQIFLGDPTKTLQHDLQRVVNDALDKARKNSTEETDPESAETQLRPGDLLITWTGTRFVTDAPATRLVSVDADSGIETTQIIDRVMAFQSFNDITLNELGLLSSPVPFDGKFATGIDAEFIVNIDGTDYDIVVTGAATADNNSIDDLVDDLNAALEAAIMEGVDADDTAAAQALVDKVKFIRQSLNGFADGNRIALKSDGIARLEMRLPDGVESDSQTNAAVVYLGLIEPVNARGLATEFFIRGGKNAEGGFDPAGLSAEIKLALDELVFAATLGFLGVEVELDEAAEIKAGFALNIVDPATGGGRVLIPDLWGQLSKGNFLYNPDAVDDGGVTSPTGFLQPELTFDGGFKFTARPIGLPDAVTDGIAAFLGTNDALEVPVAIEFGLTDAARDSDFEAGTFAYNLELGRVSALDLGFLFVEAQLDTSLIDGIEDLFKAFRNLSVADILMLLNQAVDFVSNLDGAFGETVGKIFDFPLPLVNVSLNDTLDFAQDMARTIEAVMADPGASIQELETALREALGLPTGDGFDPEAVRQGFDLRLGFDAGNESEGVDPALRFDLTFGFNFSDTLNIDLDVVQLLELAGIITPGDDLGGFTMTELLGLGGGGSLTLAGGGAFTLALGLPTLPNRAVNEENATPAELSPFIYIGDEATRLDFNLELTGENLNFEGRVLTLGVFVKEGTGSLNADFALSLDPGDGSERLLFADIFGGDVAWNDIITPSFGGSGNLKLPIYFPTENNKLFDLEVEIPSLAALVNHFFGENVLELEDGIVFDEDSALINVTPGDSLIEFTPTIPSLLDLLLDPSIIVDGIDLGLDYLEDALRGQILGIDLPVIGDALSPAADFIEGFRGQFLTPFANTILMGIGEEYDSSAHLVHDLLYRIFSEDGEMVSAFGQQFGNLGLLKGWDGNGAVTRSDIRVSGVYNNEGADDYEDWVKTDLDFIQFELSIGGSLVDLDVPTGFDIGIPGLGLALNADVNLGVDWQITLGFGIDARQGFYLVTYEEVDDDGNLVLDSDGKVQYTRDTASIVAEAKLVNTNGDTITGTLGFLQLRATDFEGEAERTKLTADFVVNLKDPKSEGEKNNRITFRDLTSRSNGISDLLSARLTGGAQVGLAVEVDFAGLDDLNISLPVSALPSVTFDFIMDWSFGEFEFFNGGGQIGDAPQVHLNDITLDLGSFIGDFAGPILDIFGEILGPLEWLIGPDGLLNQRIPILSDLAGTTITLKTLAEAFDQNAKITPFLEVAEQIFGLLKIIDQARTEAEAGDGIKLNFGSIHLNELFGDDIREVSSLGNFNQDEFDKLINDASNAADNIDFSGAQSSKQFTNTLTKGDAAFKFPILSPTAIFQLILGADDVDLVQIDLPELVFGFEYRQVFQVFGPLAATLRGAFSATLDLALGYDSYGLANFLNTDNPVDLIDGFYFSTVDFDTGERKPALTLRGEIAAGAALSLGVATAGVEGGIAATIFFDWNDPNKDTKVRLKEMLGNIEANWDNLGPLAVMSVFDITGVIEWFFKAFVDVNLLFFKFSKSWDLGGGVIAEFEIPFERQGVLGDKSGDTLTLNIGPNAGSRLQGNIADGNETIFVRTGSDGNSVEVWSPQFNVSSTLPQRFTGISKIIVNGGNGNDMIDMSGLTHDVEVQIDGGRGNNTIKLGTADTQSSATGVIRGGSGADNIFVNAPDITVDGGGGYDQITAYSRGGTIGAGSGGGNVVIKDGGDNTLEHLVTTGTNRLNLSAAGENTKHRVVFDQDIGTDNVVLGSTKDGTKTVLDFSRIQGQTVTFTLSEGKANINGTSSGSDNIIIAEWGSNRVVIDGYVDLIIGSRSGDVFNVFATHEFEGGNRQLVLDGGMGRDEYYVYAWDGQGTSAPNMDLRLRDTGTDSWNNDQLFVIGAPGDDNIAVMEDDDEFFVELRYQGGQTQRISFFNKNGVVDDNGQLITQLTDLNKVDRDADQTDAFLPDRLRLGDDFTDANLPAGIARLVIEGRAGDDVIQIGALPEQMGLRVLGEAGNDTVVIGSGVYHAWLDGVAAPTTSGVVDNVAANPSLGGLRVFGGTGNNTLIVEDSNSTAGKTGELVKSENDGWMEVELTGLGATLEFIEFQNLEVRLGKGDDRFDIRSTLYFERAEAADLIIEDLRIYGGDGDDLINLHTNEVGSSTRLFGDYTVDVMADNDGTNTGPGGNDIINIFATNENTWVYGGPGDDAINIDSIAAETLVFGGTGDDRFNVGVRIDFETGNLIDARDGAQINPLTGLRANGDNGVIQRNAGNRIGAELTLNGQDGSDSYFVWLGGQGRADINIFDTGDTGGDEMTIFGSDGDDLFLIRAGIDDTQDIGLGKTGRIGFVALFNENRASTRADIERVNYARDPDAGTGINGGISIDGAQGFGEFFVDDTLASMTLFGAEGGNYFQFGQLYNSERISDVFTGITFEDAFYTVETTRGWLSRGVSFDLTAIGAETASNEFVILNNQATLNLYGGDANDSFLVRSFAQVGSVDPQRENIDISTGGGENYIEYVVGAPVNIDGGGGFNTLVVIGTEFADDYVITEDGIFGAGRLVNFVNIQQLEVDGAEGNDRFFILGTAPGTSTVISGGLGSDAVFIGGEAPDIISRDLRGHSGIISHSLISNDARWNGLKADEISANVADNDEPGIVVTETGGRTTVVDGVLKDSYSIVLTRAPLPGSEVTVTVSMSKRPIKLEDGTRVLRDFVQFGKSKDGAFTETVELVFTADNWSVAQDVWVEAKGDEPFSGIVSGFIAHDVAGDRLTGTTTTALRVTGAAPNLLVHEGANYAPDSLRGAIVEITKGPGTGQTRVVIGNTADTLTLDKPWVLDPVAAANSADSANQSEYQIRLYEGLAMPAVQLKAYFADFGAALLEPGGGVQVIEQTGGLAWDADTPFVGSYQIVLTEAPVADTEIIFDIPNGLVLADALGNIISSLIFDAGNWDTPQTVFVAAAADDVAQKARTLEIGHSIVGGPALETLFVRVVDGDTPSVIITQSDGHTSVIEGGDLGNAGIFGDMPFVDDYSIVLSQRPDADVEIWVRAEGTRTTKGNLVNFGEQVELAIKDGDGNFINHALDGTVATGAGSLVRLIFTPDNWDQAQTVFVQALDNDVVDGGDTKVFGTRADDTSRIQGPLELRGGGGQGSLVGLPVALLFPDLETNDYLATGAVTEDADESANALVVQGDDLAAFITRYGLDFDLEAAQIYDALIGLTFRLISGQNGTYFDDQFTPQVNDAPPPPFLPPLQEFDPFDPVAQLFIPFREIVGWEFVNDIDATDGIRLLFPEQLPWSFATDAGNEYVLINSSPANFFAREEDQVDLLFVRDTNAMTNEQGRLIFYTEEPVDAYDTPLYDVDLANRGQLVGLGMGPARTIGLGENAVRLPAGIIFDEIEMLDIALGSGDNRFVIEGTHSGATRLHAGDGDSEVEIWTVAGQTTVINGLGNNGVHIGKPDGDNLDSLAEIAALLTVAGSVPEADARITVRGEPDVLAQDDSVLAQGSTNEQEVFLRNADGGTFTLRFKGAVLDSTVQSPIGEETAAIAYDASAADILAALTALEGLEDGDLSVERFGDRIVIRFTADGQYAKTPMHTFGVSSAKLTSSGHNTLNVLGTEDVGSFWALLTQTTLTGMGMPVYNAIQSVYLDDPMPGMPNRDFTLGFRGESTIALNRDMSADDIQAALEALETIGSGNVAVSKLDRVIVVRFQGHLTNQALDQLTTDADFVHIATREAGISPVDDPEITPSADASARNDIQTLTIDATGGSFTLKLDILGETGPIAHNATAAELREALQRLLANRFADDIAVQRFGNVYHIAFQGQLRAVMGGDGVGFLNVDTTALEGEAHLATRMDGVNYYGIQTLNIGFGAADTEGAGHVLNVQGTLANVTNINLNAGDDRIFISSLADLDAHTLRPDGAAFGYDFLPGHLDLIRGDLNIDAGAGRHQLMISDEATDQAKTADIGEDTDTAAAHDILGNIEIAIDRLAGGAIRYGAAPGVEGNFFDGITLWGGAYGNSFDISATHFRASEDWRTQTTLNTGLGDDTAVIALVDGLHGAFALNAQDGDDLIDATASSLPLILFGGAGDDVILGGQGGDLIFGDEGRVVYTDLITGAPVSVLGHGGRYDFTDGRRLPPGVMFSVNPDTRGDNRIFGGSGADVIVGGFGNNWIDAGAGNDIALGDGAWIGFETARPDWHGIDGILPNYIESVFDTDQLEGSDGQGRAWAYGIDPLLGGLSGIIAGGTDVILGGDGDDLVIGGSGSDILDGDDGRVDRATGEKLENLESAERNRDLVIGDNVILDRTGAELDNFTNPRFRVLTGAQIYDTQQGASGDALIDRDAQYLDPDWNGDTPVWANWVVALHDGLSHYDGWQQVRAGEYDADTVLSPDAALTHGNNYIAGGRDADMIFGQRGNNAIQGDGSIFFDIWAGAWLQTVLTADAFGAQHAQGIAALGLWDRLEQSRLAALDGNGQIIRLPQSFESADDGDDYIEGGAGTDVILGNLGQNDIIGGSSNLFGLTEYWQRDDSGANILFGGAGTRIERLDEGHGGLIDFEDRHARNASVILGDNGNIFRLVGTNGVDSGANLGFNYDATDPTRGDLRIKARGVDLLDYLRWELAQDAGIAVPSHLGFVQVIGAGDLIHGESGDDVIFGMGGDNVIFGHAGDDLIVGGFGNNWISGGMGHDGILGDDGLIFNSRNGAPEPLYGIEADQQRVISTPGGHWAAQLYTEGEMRHVSRLFGFAYETGGNDIIYGGIGNNSIHAGAGDDAISGGEALPDYFSGSLNWLMKLTQSPALEGLAPEAWFYQVGPYNPGDILQYTDVEGLWFRLYNELDPLRLMLIDENGQRVESAEIDFAFKDPDGDTTDLFNVDLHGSTWFRAGTDEVVYDFFLNFDPTEGPRDTRFPDDPEAGLPSDGDDVIFGNLGNNWIMGGTGRDHIWGGWGDNVLNADDNHHSTLFGPDPIANDVEDPYQAYADIVFGGAGRDVLIGNTGADRLIDWIGEFNTYVVPFSPFGGLHIWRLAPNPNVLDFLLELSRADGADQLLGLDRGGDPARQGEPMGEIALVTREDDAWQDQSGGPAKPFPERYKGQRELMRVALPGETAGPGGGGNNGPRTTDTSTADATPLATQSPAPSSDTASQPEGGVMLFEPSAPSPTDTEPSLSIETDANLPPSEEDDVIWLSDRPELAEDEDDDFFLLLSSEDEQTDDDMPVWHSPVTPGNNGRGNAHGLNNGNGPHK